MKFTAASALCLLLTVVCTPLAFGASYQCVKPDGRIICTVDSASDPGAQPSDLCNKSCQECYLTCSAVEVIVKGGGKIITGPGVVQEPNMVRPSGSDRQTAKEVLKQGLVQ